MRIYLSALNVMNFLHLESQTVFFLLQSIVLSALLNG